MIRNCIATFVCALTFFATLAVAGANAQQIKVVNMTHTQVWVTLYADVGAFGWAQERYAPAGFSSYGTPWVATRGSMAPNGPWKVRFEVTSPNGKRYDLFTTTWYDGAQRRFNAPGDINTYLYVCEAKGVYHWSHNPDCTGQDNTAGI